MAAAGTAAAAWQTGTAGVARPGQEGADHRTPTCGVARRFGEVHGQLAARGLQCRTHLLLIY